MAHLDSGILLLCSRAFGLDAEVLAAGSAPAWLGLWDATCTMLPPFTVRAGNAVRSVLGDEPRLGLGLGVALPIRRHQGDPLTEVPCPVPVPYTRSSSAWPDLRNRSTPSGLVQMEYKPLSFGNLYTCVPGGTVSIALILVLGLARNEGSLHLVSCGQNQQDPSPWTSVPAPRTPTGPARRSGCLPPLRGLCLSGPGFDWGDWFTISGNGACIA